MKENRIKEATYEGDKTASFISESNILLERAADCYYNMISPLYSGDAGVLSWLKKEFIADTYEGRLKRISSAINLAMEREKELK